MIAKGSAGWLSPHADEKRLEIHGAANSASPRPLRSRIRAETYYPSSMKVELDIPDTALSALRQAPAEFAACLRLMAAAKLYETGNLSQERAAELAGRSRQDFVLQLSRLGVSPFQGVEDDVASLSSLP